MKLPDTMNFEIYALYRSSLDSGVFACLAVGTDPQESFNCIFSANIEDIQELSLQPNITLCNITVTPSAVYCSGPLSQSVPMAQNLYIPLQKEFTLWDIFMVLISDEAQIKVNNKWVPINRIWVSFLSDRIAYAISEQMSGILWAPLIDVNKINNANNTDNLDVRCSRNCYLFLRDRIKGLKQLNSKSSFTHLRIDLGGIPLTYTADYSLLRFHTEELISLFTRYYVALAGLYGEICGNMFSHYLAGQRIDIPCYTFPEEVDFEENVSFNVSIKFPNPVVLMTHLIADRSAGKKLASCNSLENFTDLLLTYFDTKGYTNIYYKTFCDSFESKFSYFTEFRDHELQYNNDLQNIFTSLAVRIFTYKIALHHCNLNIPKTFSFLDGVVNVRKE